jgi:hypothetical protein
MTENEGYSQHNAGYAARRGFDNKLSVPISAVRGPVLFTLLCISSSHLWCRNIRRTMIPRHEKLLPLSDRSTALHFISIMLKGTKAGLRNGKGVVLAVS